MSDTSSSDNPDLDGDRGIPPPRQQPNTLGKGIFLGVCAVIILGGGYWAYQYYQTPPPPLKKDAPVVAVEPVVDNYSSTTWVRPDVPDDKPPPPPPDKKARHTELKPFIPPPPSINKSRPLAPVRQQTATVSTPHADPYAQAVNQLLQANVSTQATVPPDTNSLSQQLSTTQTAHVSAQFLVNRDFLLAKGAYIDCVLNTRLNSTVPGMTACTLTRDVYSDNGVTRLLERGSLVSGEYRTNMTQGQARLFIAWDRVKTPYGVVVNLGSPATSPLGEGGVGGNVDTHFWQRFGGAMMLSLVDDFVGYATTGGGQENSVEKSTQTAQNMAAEALKNTINIVPTFSKNQGERVGIYIARDIDFSSVYGLQPQ